MQEQRRDVVYGNYSNNQAQVSRKQNHLIWVLLLVIIFLLVAVIIKDLELKAYIGKTPPIGSPGPKDDPPISVDEGSGNNEGTEQLSIDKQPPIKPEPTQASIATARPLKLMDANVITKSDYAYLSGSWVWRDNRQHEYVNIMVFRFLKREEPYIIYSLEGKYNTVEFEISSGAIENSECYLEFYDYTSGELLGKTDTIDWLTSDKKCKVNIGNVDVLEIRAVGNMSNDDGGHLIMNNAVFKNE